MSLCLVTGVAGFIGSHVAERLLKEGAKVIGIDSFTTYYPATEKKNNLIQLYKSSSFRFYEIDILDEGLIKLVAGVEYIFHFAAQPGVRNNFGDHFTHYLNNNIYATQKLLEIAKVINIKKFIFASTSSIYGQNTSISISEDAIPNPLSLYAATKLATENICKIYFETFNLPVITLRLFTVYGPRQRPDMAFNLMIRSILDNKKIKIFGDGNQTRDFTFIDDVVDASLLIIQSGMAGEVYNVGTGLSISLTTSLQILQQISGRKLDIEYQARQPGESTHTLANIQKAHDQLGYRPKWNIYDGLLQEFNWLKSGC